MKIYKSVKRVYNMTKESYLNGSNSKLNEIHAQVFTHDQY